MFSQKRFIGIVFLLSVFSVESKAGTFCNTPTAPCEVGTVWDAQLCKCVESNPSAPIKVSPGTSPKTRKR